MFQNLVTQENKRDPVFPRPQMEQRHFFPSSFICKELEIKTVSKDANGANMYRISRGRFFADWIHVDRIGPLTDNRNTYVDNFTGKNSTRELFERMPMVSAGSEFQVMSVQRSMFMGIACYSSSG